MTKGITRTNTVSSQGQASSLTILDSDQFAPPGGKPSGPDVSPARLKDALITNVVGKPSVSQSTAGLQMPRAENAGAVDAMREAPVGYVRLALKLIPRQLIKHHEKTEPGKPEWLKRKIESEQTFKEAITVAEAGDNYVVLDGHHRSKVCTLSNLPYVPAFVIPYQDSASDNYIRVSRWRPQGECGDETAPTCNSPRQVEVTKDSVIKVGLSEDKFLQKSTRHQINFELPRVSIPLVVLRRIGELAEHHRDMRLSNTQNSGSGLFDAMVDANETIHLANVDQPLTGNFMSFWESAESASRKELAFSESELIQIFEHALDSRTDSEESISEVSGTVYGPVPDTPDVISSVNATDNDLMDVSSEQSVPFKQRVA